MDTRVNLSGLELDNPIIPASGTFGFGYEFAELRRKDIFLCSLSERNWLIYKYHFIDGCSEESTAKQAGCSRRTVSTVAQFLRENLDKNCTIIKRGRKKNGKNHKKNDPGHN